MKSIKLKISENETLSIDWEGYSSRWEMFESLFFNLFRYYKKRRPDELRELIKMILTAYRVSRGKL